jgi:hypothetical protein
VKGEEDENSSYPKEYDHETNNRISALHRGILSPRNAFECSGQTTLARQVPEARIHTISVRSIAL